MGFKIDEGCVNSSIKSNNFECLKYCLENGGKITLYSYNYLKDNKKQINEKYERIKNYINENFNYNDILMEEQKNSSTLFDTDPDY